MCAVCTQVVRSNEMTGQSLCVQQWQQLSRELVRAECLSWLALLPLGELNYTSKKVVQRIEDRIVHFVVKA